MTPLTRSWVRKAEADFRAARRELLVKRGASHHVVCFLCQQCVEKYLKARLIEAGLKFPRVHDLLLLLSLVIPVEPNWGKHNRACAALTDYAVEVRYPGVPVTRADARSAMNRCERLRLVIRKVLGLRSGSAP